MRFVIHQHPAFSLVEVLVAIVILSIAMLSLAASASVALRQITDDGQTLRAATLGQQRAEQSFALPCQTINAVDSSNGITTVTHATTANAMVQIDLANSYKTRYGSHTEQYTFAGGCY